MTEISAVYGPPRDRNAALMTAAWLDALGHLTAQQLAAAIARAIRTLKFWPTPAEILAIVEEKRDPPRRLPEYRAEPNNFQNEDVRARVKAMVKAFVHQFGPEPTTMAETSKPASQDMHVSDELKASVAKLRSKTRGAA